MAAEAVAHPLAARFERFGREAEDHASPFYARLARCVAGERELLELAALAPREPVPNLFFGALHYLILRGASDPLARHYAAARGAPPAEDSLAAALRDFCDRHRAELAQLLRTRLVQTNEVNRAACLLPAFEVVHALGGRRPLGLLEVGASAGLNLLFDRYGYAYGDGRRAGRAEALLQLRCELRGAGAPPIPARLPDVGMRLGIDLYPVDLTQADARLWLRALVWPDHLERAERLVRACAAALEPPGPPPIIAGDVLDVLPQALFELHPTSTPCVFHSALLVQLSLDAQKGFDALLSDASRARPIFRIAAEEQRLSLLTYAEGGLRSEQELAAFDGHGRWLEWRAPSAAG